MLAQVFAWALQPDADAAETGRVGSNFGRAHRDKSYADCHFSDARLGMLTTWVPLVPVTSSNGCIFVVPANKDPLLSASESPYHLRPDDSICALGEADAERESVQEGSSCRSTQLSHPIPPYKREGGALARLGFANSAPKEGREHLCSTPWGPS